MDYAIAIFFLGVMVSLVVAKGMLMANEYAASERDEFHGSEQSDKSQR